MKGKSILTILMALSAGTLVLAGCDQKGTTSTGGSESDPPISGSEPVAETPKEIKNGSFEEGLAGWNTSGTAFDEGDVVDATSFQDGQAVVRDGDHHYAGATETLASFTGTMTSDPFELSGIGMLELRIGAMKDKENLYIEFFLASDAEYKSPLSFKKNGGEESLTRLTNDDFDGVGVLSSLIVNVVDLREHLGEEIVVRVTDNARGTRYEDYAFVNLDGIRTIQNSQEMADALQEREDQLALLQQEPIDQDPPVTELRNGGFEDGLSYWLSVSGTAFRQAEEDLLWDSDGKYWGTRDYFGEGEKFLTTFNNETLTGTLRSEKFLVEDQGEGKSYASFLLGAAAQESCYIAVNDGTTGQEILRQGNPVFSDPALAEGLVRFYVDLSDHVGETLYFTIVDNAPSGPFGAIEADDFKINLSQQEVVEGIAADRAWAETCPDSVAQPAYVSAYNGGISYPLAGEAPTFVHEGEHAYQVTRNPGAFDATSLLRSLVAKDDYTATSAIKLAIESATKDGEPASFEDYSSVTLEEGEYVFTVSAEDAYGQKATGTVLVTCDPNYQPSNTIVNGGFETGDLTGWTVTSGDVNVDNAVIADQVWWDVQVPYNKEGEYHFDGWKACGVEGDGYTLRSTDFLLGGSGQISFRMGGNAARVNVRDAGTNQVVASYWNDAFFDGGVAYPSVYNGSRLATMTKYVADLSAHIGKTLYIEIQDAVITGGWAVAFFDEIVTYYETRITIEGQYDTVHEESVDGSESRDTQIPWRAAALL